MSQDDHACITNTGEVPVPRSPFSPVMTMSVPAGLPQGPPLVPLTMWSPHWFGQNLASPVVQPMQRMVWCNDAQPAYIAYKQANQLATITGHSDVSCPRNDIAHCSGLRWPGGIVVHGSAPLKTAQYPSCNQPYMASNLNVIPAYMNQVPPLTTFQVQTPANCIPTTTVLMPTIANQIPALPSQIPMPASQLAVQPSQMAMPTSQIPTATCQIPTLASQMPLQASQMPSSASQMPSSASQVPSTPCEIPTNNNNLPIPRNIVLVTETIDERIYQHSSVIQEESKQLSNELANHTEIEACSLPTGSLDVTVKDTTTEQEKSHSFQEPLASPNNLKTKDSFRKTGLPFLKDVCEKACDSPNLFATQNQTEIDNDIKSVNVVPPLLNLNYDNNIGSNPVQGDKVDIFQSAATPAENKKDLTEVTTSSRESEVKPSSHDSDLSISSNYSSPQLHANDEDAANFVQSNNSSNSHSTDLPWSCPQLPQSVFSSKHCCSESSFSHFSPESSLSRTRSESSLNHSWLTSPSSHSQDTTFRQSQPDFSSRRNIADETGNETSQSNPNDTVQSDSAYDSAICPARLSAALKDQVHLCADATRSSTQAEDQPDNDPAPVTTLQEEHREVTSSQQVTGHRSGLPRRTMYTCYSWPPIKVVIPERSTMTPQLFGQIDRKVCQLYTQFTNNYQIWLKTKEDRSKPDVGSEEAIYLDSRLHTLEQYLASIHVDMDSYVTFYEVQTATRGCMTCPLSTWQTRNLTAVRHHLAELRRWQSESACGLPLFNIRQQKLLELSQKEAVLMSEVMIPRLPADSPGNNTRCLTSLLASNLQPAKAAFVQKKIDALKKKAGRNANCPDRVMNIDVLHQRSQ